MTRKRRTAEHRVLEGSMRTTVEDVVTTFLFATFGLFIVSTIAAWITHIVWVIGKITGVASISGGEMAIGVLGAFCPPIGAVHGFIIWLS